MADRDEGGLQDIYVCVGVGNSENSRRAMRPRTLARSTWVQGQGSFQYKILGYMGTYTALLVRHGMGGDVGPAREREREREDGMGGMGTSISKRAAGGRCGQHSVTHPAKVRREGIGNHSALDPFTEIEESLDSFGQMETVGRRARQKDSGSHRAQRKARYLGTESTQESGVGSLSPDSRTLPVLK